MFKAQVLVQPNRVFEESGGFEIAALETLRASVIEGNLCQLFRQALSTHGGQEVHFLQFTDVRLATAKWRNSASADNVTVLLDNPVGMAWLAIKLI